MLPAVNEKFGKKALEAMAVSRKDIVQMMWLTARIWVLVHHNAATQNAAMHNASFSQRYPYPLFLQRHRCDALPCFSASPVVIFYIAHIALRPLLPFSFRHNGLLYKATRNLPRVTTQRCRHWQRQMAIANANANAAMRCTKIWVS